MDSDPSSSPGGEVCWESVTPLTSSAYIPDMKYQETAICLMFQVIFHLLLLLLILGNSTTLFEYRKKEEECQVKTGLTCLNHQG